MTLTAAGGLLGEMIFGGIAMALPGLTGMQTAVPFWAIAAGLIVSTSVGLIFGVWPALKAARLDPVEALRYE